jgi:hypothetical protein
MNNLNKYREVSVSDTAVRIGIPVDNAKRKGEMVFLMVRSSNVLPEGDIGIRYLDRMVLTPEYFNQLHRAQMSSDFETMRKIFDGCVDMEATAKEKRLEIEKKMLGV